MEEITANKEDITLNLAISIPPAADHKISKDDAKRLIKNRKDSPTGKIIEDSIKGVIFNISVFKEFLAIDECKGVRFYFAKEKASVLQGVHGNINANDMIPTLVAVAINAKGQDILDEDGNGKLKAAAENTWPYPPHGDDDGNLDKLP